MPGSDVTPRRAAPVDYETDLDRFLTNQSATRLFSTSGDVHESVAARLRELHPGGRVLDLGGGNGVLARHLQDRGLASVVLDQAGYAATAPPPVVLGDAERLPFGAGVFHAVAALWMLYHVADPVQVLRVRATHVGHQAGRPGVGTRPVSGPRATHGWCGSGCATTTSSWCGSTAAAGGPALVATARTACWSVAPARARGRNELLPPSRTGSR
jgi:hypothetical protein